jgi:hypothetical protein
VQNEKKYNSSKIVEAIQGMLAQHGNKALVDATLKKTTHEYI